MLNGIIGFVLGVSASAVALWALVLFYINHYTARLETWVRESYGGDLHGETNGIPATA